MGGGFRSFGWAQMYIARRSMGGEHSAKTLQSLFWEAANAFVRRCKNIDFTSTSVVKAEAVVQRHSRSKCYRLQHFVRHDNNGHENAVSFAWSDSHDSNNSASNLSQSRLPPSHIIITPKSPGGDEIQEQTSKQTTGPPPRRCPQQVNNGQAKISNFA